MSFTSEFREFITRGNVIDLAVGVIIGGAFNKIVTSVVDNVIMPPLGLLLGGVDFSDLKIELKAAEGENPAVNLNYGLFINDVVSFLILAFVIFWMIKLFNTFKRKEEAPEETPAGPTQEELLAEIRDLLKQGNSPS